MFDFPVNEHIYSPHYGGLRLFVFEKDEHRLNLQPAIVFFHGAGFSTHQVTPSQFQHHANYFSSKGSFPFAYNIVPETLKVHFHPLLH